MAQSREEFMRQMGISTDDALDPSKKQTKFTTRFSSGAEMPPAQDEKPSGSVRFASNVEQKPQPSSYGSSYGQPKSALRSTSDSYDSYEQPRSSYASQPPQPQYHEPQEYPKMASPTNQSVAPSALLSSAAGGGGSPSARDEFLRSLGIDNMDHPDTTAPEVHVAPALPSSKASQRQTASQEYMKGSAAASSAYSYEAPQKENVHHRASTRDYDSPTKYGSNASSPKASPFKTTMQQDSIIGLKKKPSAGSLKQSSSGMAGSMSGSFSASASANSGGDDPRSATELKEEGNKYFEEGEYRRAVRLYSKAIEKDPSNPALYSNRSAAYLQASKQMGIDTRMMALRDADKVIELKPIWFKGFSRRGDALFKLERCSEAAEAYERALELDPANTNLMHSMGEARNAAGKTHPKHASSWATAPSKKMQDQSAHEMVNELRQNMERSNPDLKVGNDYREAALERFRSGKATSSLSSYCGPSEESDSSATPVSPPRRRLDRSEITEEFSSAAAFNYQQNLLDAYRRKKAMQQ